MNEITTCPTCKNKYTSDFCPYCGEKRIDTGDLRITIVIEDIVDVFFNFNRKIFRTLVLLFKPGYLSNSYLIGRRKKFIPPAQFFTTLNIVFYLALANVAIFFTRVDQMSLGYQNYFLWTNVLHVNVDGLIKAKSTKFAESIKDVNKSVNESAKNYSKAAIMITIPLLGFLLQWTMRSYYIKSHLAVLQFLSFYLVLILLTVLGFVMTHRKNVSDLQLLPIHIGFIIYIIFSIKYIFQLSIFQSIIKGIIFAVFFFAIINLYKQLILIFCLLFYRETGVIDTGGKCLVIGLLVIFLGIGIKDWIKEKKQA